MFNEAFSGFNETCVSGPAALVYKNVGSIKATCGGDYAIQMSFYSDSNCGDGNTVDTPTSFWGMTEIKYGDCF